MSRGLIPLIVQAERIAARLGHACWADGLPRDIGEDLTARCDALRDLAASFSPQETAKPSYHDVHAAANELVGAVATLLSALAAHVYLMQWDHDDSECAARRAVSVLHPSVQHRCDVLLAQVWCCRLRCSMECAHARRSRCLQRR